MGQIIAGLASSHAYTWLAPDQWDARRETTRKRYASRYGVEPPEPPQLAAETLEGDQLRYARIRDGLFLLRAKFEELSPDALVLIGDDQDENFREGNLPQLAIYSGEELTLGGRGHAEQ